MDPVTSQTSPVKVEDSTNDKPSDSIDAKEELAVLKEQIDQSGSDDNISVEASPTKSAENSPSKESRKRPHEDDKDKADGGKDRDEDGPSQARSKREKQEQDRLRMQVLVSHFSEEQLNRYEMFRRAAFPKAAIKRLMSSITTTSLSQNVVIAMSGIAKVYVGEIVEAALDVMEQWGESGPIQPKHLRETVRRMKHRGGIPNTKYTKKLFR